MLTPNQNLKDQLKLARLILAEQDKGELDISLDLAGDLAALVIGLNEWLSRGGELPDRWCAKARRFR